MTAGAYASPLPRHARRIQQGRLHQPLRGQGPHADARQGPPPRTRRSAEVARAELAMLMMAMHALAACRAQVKGNGYMFGAYTHVSWPVADGVVADPSCRSFVFYSSTARASRCAGRCVTPMMAPSKSARTACSS